MSDRLTPERLTRQVAECLVYQEFHIFVLISPFGTLLECLTQIKHAVLLCIALVVPLYEQS